MAVVQPGVHDDVVTLVRQEFADDVRKGRVVVNDHDPAASMRGGVHRSVLLARRAVDGVTPVSCRKQKRQTNNSSMCPVGRSSRTACSLRSWNSHWPHTRSPGMAPGIVPLECNIDLNAACLYV